MDIKKLVPKSERIESESGIQLKYTEKFTGVKSTINMRKDIIFYYDRDEPGEMVLFVESKDMEEPICIGIPMDDVSILINMLDLIRGME
jgi:hypothetical protein